MYIYIYIIFQYRHTSSQLFNAVVEKHTSVQHFPDTVFLWQHDSVHVSDMRFISFWTQTSSAWFTHVPLKSSHQNLTSCPRRRDSGDESSQYRLLFTTAHQSREGLTDWKPPNRVERKSSFEPPRLPRARDGAGEQPVLIYSSLTSRYLLDCRAKWNTSSLKPS